MAMQHPNNLDLSTARFFMTYEQPREVMQGKLQAMDSRLVVGDPSSGKLFAGPQFRVMFDCDRPYGKRNWMLVGSSVTDIGNMVESLKALSPEEQSWSLSPFAPNTPIILMEVGQDTSDSAFLGYLVDTSQDGRFERMSFGFDPLENTLYQQRWSNTSRTTAEKESMRFREKFLIASRYCSSLQVRLDKVMNEDDQNAQGNVADRLFTDVVYLYCDESQVGCDKPLGGFGHLTARSEIDPEEREARMPAASFIEEIKATTQWSFSEQAALNCWMPLVELQGLGNYSMVCESEDVSATHGFSTGNDPANMKELFLIAVLSMGNKVEQSYQQHLIGAAVGRDNLAAADEDNDSRGDVYGANKDLYAPMPVNR